MEEREIAGKPGSRKLERALESYFEPQHALSTLFLCNPAAEPHTLFYDQRTTKYSTQTHYKG